MTSKVVVALQVKSLSQRAFDAFVREIGLWWRPNDLFRFTAGPAGPHGVRALAGQTFDRDRPRRPGVRDRSHHPLGARRELVFTWRQASFAPDQSTEVEVRFESLDRETRVTVEHSGWDALPADHVARHGFPDRVFLSRHAEWWRDLLASFSRSL
jgi:hypothetical protein